MVEFVRASWAFEVSFVVEKNGVEYAAYAEKLDKVYYPSVAVTHQGSYALLRASKCSKPLIALRRAITHACELAGEPERAQAAIAELEAKVKAVGND